MKLTLSVEGRPPFWYSFIFIIEYTDTDVTELLLMLANWIITVQKGTFSLQYDLQGYFKKAFIHLTPIL